MKENQTLELGRKMSMTPMSYSSDLLMMCNCGVIKITLCSVSGIYLFLLLLLLFCLFFLVFVLFFVCFIFYFVCLLSFFFFLKHHTYQNGLVCKMLSME